MQGSIDVTTVPYVVFYEERWLCKPDLVIIDTYYSSVIQIQYVGTLFVYMSSFPGAAPTHGEYIA